MSSSAHILFLSLEYIPLFSCLGYNDIFDFLSCLCVCVCVCFRGVATLRQEAVASPVFAGLMNNID